MNELLNISQSHPLDLLFIASSKLEIIGMNIHGFCYASVYDNEKIFIVSDNKKR